MMTKMYYTDFSSGTPVPDSEEIPLDFLPNANPASEAYVKNGHFVNNGTMRLDTIKVFVNYSSGPPSVYKQVVVPAFTILSTQTLFAEIDDSLLTLVSPTSSSLPWFALYYSPSDVTFESANFGEGRIVYNTSGGGGSTYSYEYFCKDHLGSTRAVLDYNEDIIEATMYQPYGTMSQVGSGSAAIPVREKFTTKEFDEEGKDSASGLIGIGAYYFGARYFDPEVGIWTTTDPKHQISNLYGYSSNPISTIDPNGEWIQALFAAAQWYLGGVMSNNGEVNPAKWNWNDPGQIVSTIMTGLSVGTDLWNDIANLTAAKSQTTNADEFGHAGAADKANVRPSDRHSNTDDPIRKQLNTRTSEYKSKKLPETPYECSRYTGYEIEGKILTPEQLTAMAKGGNTITITDPSTLDPSKVYAVSWQQADPEKLAKLIAAGKPIQHSGAYYKGDVWHVVNKHYYISEFNYLQSNMSNAGYTIGPTFRLW